jgi:hypothetical protein
MAWSAILTSVLVGLLSAACAEADRTPMPAGPPAQTVQAEGLALTALGGAWRAFPPDLERYYVPVEAVLVNDRGERVPLRLSDFALLDVGGQGRAPLPPREATTRLFGAYGRRSAIEPPLAGPPAGTILPARGYFFFQWRLGWPYYAYGPYYPYGYGPYYPYYGAPRRPTYEEATGDLLRYGLADGGLEPRASLRGFLYFPRGDRDEEMLRLRWAAPGLATPLVAPVAEPH